MFELFQLEHPLHFELDSSNLPSPPKPRPLPPFLQQPPLPPQEDDVEEESTYSPIGPNSEHESLRKKRQIKIDLKSLGNPVEWDQIGQLRLNK